MSNFSDFPEVELSPEQKMGIEKRMTALACCFICHALLEVRDTRIQQLCANCAIQRRTIDGLVKRYTNLGKRLLSEAERQRILDTIGKKSYER